MIESLRRRARLLALRFRHEFRQGIEDPNVPLSLDMERDSSTLLVAFGGMRGQLGMPPFEFFKATGAIPVKRLFVRDLRQAWYHRGIPGHGSSIEGVAESLGELVARHGVERLVVAGNSAGGYAALLFGSLLGADAVLCFAPQTVIELDVLAEMDDHRWDEQLEELLAAGDLDPRWTDLRRALPGARRGATRYELYFDHSFTTDRLHAERLAGLEGVRLHRFDGGAHGIAREMRETGELQRVLQEALGADARQLSGEVS
jgi:pimeloyl-ACP methyl ester carboxylesterase